MTLIETFSDSLANVPNCVVILSGGMDSAIAARLCVHKYGAQNVHALSFFYQQKQSIELEKAKVIASNLQLAHHQILDISFLGDIARPLSANIVGGRTMPTIKEVLGDPTPPTYVPNRNAILMMIGAAYAESNGLGTVVTGLQSQDQYGYHDTTPSFVNSVNALLAHARTRQVQVSAPFLSTNKATEILLLNEMDGNVDLLADTLTCYDPSDTKVSCGRCPSCSERIANFMKAGMRDPVPYQIAVPWSL